MHKILHTLNPAISKRWLLVLAGLMWTMVGIMLIRYAVNWLAGGAISTGLTWGTAGVALGVVVYRFGFSGVARKNIRRIHAAAERTCLFAFQDWKGYLIIAVMMTAGILLRASSLPREPLAVLYLTIGGGLLLSSGHYYRHFTRLAWQKDPANF